MAEQDIIKSQESLDRYLTFKTDSQLFGVSVADVVQIVGMQEITGLPESPYYLRGIISLRGEIFPVIDMRRRLGKPDTACNERTCIIITNIQGSGFGFVVDEVDEVCDITGDEISPPPLSSSSGSTYLTGIARHVGGQGKKEKMILIIDITKLLREDEFASLAQKVNE